MLTPAEEQGLAGLAVASRVQHALYRLAPTELAGLIERLRAGALAQHVIYLHDGDDRADPDPARPDHGAAGPGRLPPPRHPDRAERAQAAAGALPPRLHRARDPPPARRGGALAPRVLGAEPGGAQPGLRPARRADRLHQPDVEGHAAVRRAQPERHRRPAHGADLRAADRRHRRAGAARGRPRARALGGHRHARAAHPGAARPPGRDRQRAAGLLRRAQVRRQRPGRAGSSSPAICATATASR